MGIYLRFCWDMPHMECIFVGGFEIFVLVLDTCWNAGRRHSMVGGAPTIWGSREGRLGGVAEGVPDSVVPPGACPHMVVLEPGPTGHRPVWPRTASLGQGDGPRRGLWRPQGRDGDGPSRAWGLGCGNRGSMPAHGDCGPGRCQSNPHIGTWLQSHRTRARMKGLCSEGGRPITLHGDFVASCCRPHPHMGTWLHGHNVCIRVWGLRSRIRHPFSGYSYFGAPPAATKLLYQDIAPARLQRSGSIRTMARLARSEVAIRGNHGGRERPAPPSRPSCYEVDIYGR